MIKKNITINFCGRLYAIDEDAYELLKHYTESIRRYFSKTEGGDEIADDIESRIAELFDEQKTNGANAITIELAESIIHRIGELDDIAPKDDASEEAESADSKEEKGNGSAADEFISSVKDSANNAWNTMKSNKRYYRDTQNKIIGGVLAGCAQYFGGSPLAWRICFLLLIFLCHAITDAGILFFAVCYILMTIIAPEANAPEEVLQMKGEQVTPQNLAEEVTRQNNAKPGIFHEFISIIVKILLFLVCLWVAGMLIGLLSATAVFFTEPLTWFAKWFPWDVTGVSDIFEAVRIPFFICGGAVIVLLCSLTYCAFHALASSFGKTESMGFKQRIVWLIVVIACFVTMIASGFKVATQGGNIESKWVNERMKIEETEWANHHTMNGIVFENEKDWSYFKHEGWNLIKAENCENGELTRCGEYYNDDKDYRYLNVYSNARDILFHAEKEVKLDAGKYNFSCLARSSKDSYGVFMFVTVDNGDDHKKHLLVFPAFGNEGRQIYSDSTYAIPNIGTSPDLNKAISANDSKGYGWAYISLKSIDVPKGATVRFGISTEPDFTGETCNAEWLSACDFKVEKQ